MGEENPEVPLQTRTIPLEEVKANIEKWKPSIEADYESLVSNTKAVEPLSDEGYQHGEKRTKLDTSQAE